MKIVCLVNPASTLVSSSFATCKPAKSYPTVNLEESHIFTTFNLDPESVKVSLRDALDNSVDEGQSLRKGWLKCNILREIIANIVHHLSIVLETEMSTSTCEDLF